MKYRSDSLYVGQPFSRTAFRSDSLSVGQPLCQRWNDVVGRTASMSRGPFGSFYSSILVHSILFSSFYLLLLLLSLNQETVKSNLIQLSLIFFTFYFIGVFFRLLKEKTIYPVKSLPIKKVVKNRILSFVNIFIG